MPVTSGAVCLGCDHVLKTWDDWTPSKGTHQDVKPRIENVLRVTGWNRQPHFAPLPQTYPYRGTLVGARSLIQCRCAGVFPHLFTEIGSGCEAR